MREPKYAEALCSSFGMHAPMKTFIGHQAPVCPHPQPQLCLGICACAVRHAGWEASKVVPDMVLYCQKASEDAGHSDPGPRVLMLELLTVGGGKDLGGGVADGAVFFSSKKRVWLRAFVVCLVFLGGRVVFLAKTARFVRGMGGVVLVRVLLSLCPPACPPSPS